jgi:hypothetical protein
MKTVYVEKKLSDVTNFFAQGFKPKPTEKIISHYAVVDTSKDLIVFVLQVADKPNEDSKIMIDPPEFISGDSPLNPQK